MSMVHDRENRRAFVGPHEGRELELMLSGSKPLSMFIEPVGETEFEYFPEEEFDKLVVQGKLLKNVTMEMFPDPRGGEEKCRRVLYALPGEDWRIRAMSLVLELYRSLVPGWRPDLD